MQQQESYSNSVEQTGHNSEIDELKETAKRINSVWSWFFVGACPVKMQLLVSR